MRALVTGATGQVGRACGQLLTLQGWQVVGVSRGGSHLAGYHSLDLVEYDSQVENFVYEQPSFDLVIMTHGVQQPAEVGQLNFYRIYEEVREVNLDSVVYLTDQLIEQDKLNPGALIIYCSSIHATQPRKSRGPYAVAKAGLEALARVVAIEQADKGIRAVALRLGQMEKPMAGIVFTPEQEVAIKECTPLKWVSPDEVAALCLALYGQKSMTASVIDLDSGHSINIWPD